LSGDLGKQGGREMEKEKEPVLTYKLSDEELEKYKNMEDEE
jgi:hypothetical protein